MIDIIGLLLMSISGISFVLLIAWLLYKNLDSGDFNG